MNDKTVKPVSDELFDAIISSNILEPYKLKDPGLVEILKDSNNSNIIYSQSFIAAKVVKRNTQLRIDWYISIGHEKEPIIKSAQQLVTFCEKHDNAHLCGAIFKGTKYHYTVWCGKVESYLHAICVMQGGQIPDDEFKMESQ
jgi:hypothetical protein